MLLDNGGRSSEARQRKLTSTVLRNAYRVGVGFLFPSETPSCVFSDAMYFKIASQTFWLVAHGLVILGVYMKDNDASKILRGGDSFHWISLVFPLMFVLNAAFYFATSLMDPGFVPLSDQDAQSSTETDEEAELLREREHEKDVVYRNLSLGQCRRIPTASQPQGNDWCTYCDILKVCRSKHCRQCNRCVRRHDHHCGWVGNCIGQRNHPFFIAYVTFQCACMALAAYLLLQSLLHQSSPVWSSPNALQLFSLVLVFLFALMVLPLSVTHIYFMCANLTTYEFVRGRNIWYMGSIPEKYEAPFSRGCYYNLQEFWCDPNREYIIPTTQSLEERDAKESLCSNRFYDCC